GPLSRGESVGAGRAGGSAPRSQRLDGELAALVARAQDLLVELADAGLRNLRDEAPPLGYLPLRDARGEELGEVGRCDIRARLAHHAREWPLLPAGVAHADDARLDDVGARHQVALELHPADPLAPAFD